MAGSPRVRFQSPVLPEVQDVLAHFEASRRARFFSNGGPAYQRLTQRLQERLGAGAHPVVVSNATTGLMLAVRALAGTPSEGKQLILMPSYTFVAMASAVVWAGFQPVFCDVDATGWHLDPSSLAAALEAHGHEAALVLAGSTFGTPAPSEQVERWRELANRAGVGLLVDSAAGFGSCRPDGSALASDGDIDVYSFHATKPFAIGEGGLVVARDPHVAGQVQRLANFGFDSDRDVTTGLGFNAKLDEWHCSTALAVLDGFDEVLARRRAIASTLGSTVADLGWTLQAGNALSAHQFLPCLTSCREQRDALLEEASRRGIEVRAYFDRPLHQLTALKNAPTAPLPVTADLSRRTVSLPVANDLTADDLDAISTLCKDVASSFGG